ncbi:phosphonate C-P lyase system protein PhnG [Agarivorans sp. Toyoura001]|uniref:phosphonate C-P lyase system protein PhnG n=1 Tax=Agarivorans sp. Toyoura001 TaxID=2283141 RepID=UPI0010D46ADE|nr:phosphonate C-P lyase system protein PhnG [Agarivorans sp. Toyoura001]GDY25589.1 phosphonate C-P lyase system protein PhnG [Agarivorans sp. Toyoura001]
MSHSQTQQPSSGQSIRQHWMAVLANASYPALVSRWQQLNLDPECEVIRQPEVGLARLQGRVGGTGERFNLGDTTITRAAVRLSDGTLGYGYLRGRAKQHALLSAVIDALMQNREYAPSLQEAVIQPLAELQQQAKHKTAEHAAQSKVDFFTVVRGED